MLVALYAHDLIWWLMTRLIITRCSWTRLPECSVDRSASEHCIATPSFEEMLARASDAHLQAGWSCILPAGVSALLLPHLDVSVQARVCEPARE